MSEPPKSKFARQTTIATINNFLSKRKDDKIGMLFPINRPEKKRGIMQYVEEANATGQLTGGPFNIVWNDLIEKGEYKGVVIHLFPKEAAPVEGE